MTSAPPIAPSVSLAATLDVIDVVLASLDRRLPPYVSRDDLASAGKLALIEALVRFAGTTEEARAYCFVRVRGAVLDELRRQDPLSRHTRTRVTLVQRASAALTRELGRSPTAIEIASATGLPANAVTQLQRIATAIQVCSTDEADAEGNLLHALVDSDAPCPARAAESVDAHASIRDALDRLAPNHAHVLRRYYLDDATLDDIGEELGVSKERVRQIREAAEKKLREDFVVLALWQSLLTRG